jgi:hypothetical protein
MVAFDRSELSKQALRYPCELADELKADLIVTNVINQRDVDMVKWNELSSLDRSLGGKINKRVTSCGTMVAGLPAFSARAEKVKGFLKVYIHAYGFDPESRQRIKEVIKDKTPPLYILDHEANTRTVYQVPKAGYEES